MKVPIAEVRKTLESIIRAKSELTKQEAEILANDYIEGELQGKKSHGVAAFPAMAEVLGLKNRKKHEILKETEAFLYVEGNSDFGAIIGREVADALMIKAKKQGVSMAAIRNMKSWLRPATVASYIASQGFIALVTNTGGPPMVSPPGGKEPVIGTNPIGIGVPGAEGSLVIDMATSTRAWGEVRLAKRFNHDLPAGSFLDKNGEPTLVADEAYSALAMGGYKGFGLGLFIELLDGALVDMPMGQGDPGESYHTRTRGANILVINPVMTIGREQLGQKTSAFVDSIRKSPAAAGKRVTLPGDRSSKLKADHLKNRHLELDDDLWNEIKSIK